MRSYRYLVLDVFTDRPLTGNQLAVFTDARELPEHLLQPLAREVNFSETVFVLPPERDGHVRIRIFTPSVELPFAGHPTLGTAFALAGPLQLGEIRLETGAGTVAVGVDRDETGRIVFGRMEQPLPTHAPWEREPELLAALGVERSELPVEVYDNGVRHVYVTLGGAAEVAALDPDLRAIAALGAVGVNCVAPSQGRWKVRMFGPGLGVAEDAATGSAAGPLAVHLARHGRVAWGEQIEVEQGAELGRPSLLRAQAEAVGGEVASVRVGGAAVVVARGEYRL